MKMKNLVVFALLFVIGFSVAHTLIVETDKNSVHCSEFDNSHDDGNCGCHQAFVLPQDATFFYEDYVKISQVFEVNSYYFYPHLDFLKPPIS